MAGERNSAPVAQQATKWRISSRYDQRRPPSGKMRVAVFSFWLARYISTVAGTLRSSSGGASVRIQPPSKNTWVCSSQPS